jgi:hypothetical protein
MREFPFNLEGDASVFQVLILFSLQKTYDNIKSEKQSIAGAEGHRPSQEPFRARNDERS